MASSERVNQKLTQFSEINRETEKVIGRHSAKIFQLMKEGKVRPHSGTGQRGNLEGLDLAAVRKRYEGFMKQAEQINAARCVLSPDEIAIERVLDTAMAAARDILRESPAIDRVLDQRSRAA